MTECVQFAADTLHGHYTFHDNGDDCRRHPWIKIKLANSQGSCDLDVAIVGRVQLWYHRKERRVMTTVTYQKFVNFKTENNCESVTILMYCGIHQYCVAFFLSADHICSLATITWLTISFQWLQTSAFYYSFSNLAAVISAKVSNVW